MLEDCFKLPLRVDEQKYSKNSLQRPVLVPNLNGRYREVVAKRSFSVLLHKNGRFFNVILLTLMHQGIKIPVKIDDVRKKIDYHGT